MPHNRRSSPWQKYTQNMSFLCLYSLGEILERFRSLFIGMFSMQCERRGWTGTVCSPAGAAVGEVGSGVCVYICPTLWGRVSVGAGQMQEKVCPWVRWTILRTFMGQNQVAVVSLATLLVFFFSLFLRFFVHITLSLHIL